MKQILQSLKTGATEVAEVPCPAPQRGQLLVRTSRTLVSAGTERMLVEFGKANWIDKARQQPDKVQDGARQDAHRRHGPTLDAVRNKLDQPLPLGYCNVGTVIDVGAGVTGFALGDRVVSNGRHAEIVAVPTNLCAKVPAGVGDEEAAFTVLGAIALQGIRLVEPTLGEAVVVTGLGLIGLVTVQLLRANGCRVLGLDFDPAKLALARRFGAEVVDLRDGADPVQAAQAFSRGRGVDAVLVTAATKSSEPMHQAAQMCRKRGRIVLVGVTGLELSRADFFEKELTFQVSCSYGPGRYDPDYEEKGQDYPVGFVRWTEQRNFEAVLDMMAARRLDVAPLISHRFAIDDAEQAYALVGGAAPSLGIVLSYPETPAGEAAATARIVRVAPATAPAAGRAATLGFIGAGNYAGAVLMPAFKATGARLHTLVSAGGVSSMHVGRKFGFEHASTDSDALLAAGEVDSVVVATRHDSHAAFVLAARAAGKHVFVEKPLCLTLDELHRIEAAYDRQRGADPDGRLQPPLRAARAAHEGAAALGAGPKLVVITVNAGAIPPITGPRIQASAAAASSARLPLHRSGALPRRRADHRARRPRDGHDSARHGDDVAVVRRRLDRHGALPRQRQQGVPEGAGRGVRGRPHPAARQLPAPDGLRLAGLRVDAPVAPGQGPAGVRARLRRRRRHRLARADSARRADRGRARLDRDPGVLAISPALPQRTIDIVAGARPNFMKVAPIIRALRARAAVGGTLAYRLVHTGQHYDQRMSGDFFAQLEIPAPDVNLDVGSGSQAEQTAAIMVGYERLLLAERSDLCLVVGDVTSTMACAIAAQKLGVPVAHVEAGIRSGDWSMPEEINRMVTDAITNWFFTTSEAANANLRGAGIDDERIFFVGNTMIDTLLAQRHRFRAAGVLGRAPAWSPAATSS